MNGKSEAELLADFQCDFVQAWQRAEADDNMPEVVEKEVFEAERPDHQ